MRLLLPVLLTLLTGFLGLTLLPGAEPNSPPNPLQGLATPGAALRVAAAHAGTLPPEQRCSARYLSLHALPPAERAAMAQVLGFAANSLSARQPLFLPTPLVGGLIVYLDLSFLGIDPKDMDRLGAQGSGPAPFPEPYFHQVRYTRQQRTRTVQEEYTCTVREPYTCWEDIPPAGIVYGPWPVAPMRRQVTRYREREVTRTRTRQVMSWEKASEVRLNDCFPVDAVIALRELTHSEFPIFEARWFLANALIEPRYHELLGTGESLASVQRLAGLNQITVTRVRASQLRGVVLFSEVAQRNRRLERSPTPARQGRGSFWISYDFKTSLRGQDALADLLGENADANESIFSLFNGLHGYYINDGQGQRLDAADPSVALDSRTRLRRKVIDTGYHCMGCHTAEAGLVLVDDEVRRTSRPEVSLAIERLKKQGDVSRAERIQDRYLTDDVNELIESDRLLYVRAVRDCTGGLTPAKVNQVLQLAVWQYLDSPVTLESIAWDVGQPPETIRLAVQAASELARLHEQDLDSHLVGLALGRPQRRDQMEPVLGLLQDALCAYQGGRH